MGKAQSKRSVDITTDVKKDDVLEEGTGKMGKIEDIDQVKPQVNGDTHHNDTEGNEKEKTADTEATENEKDLSTEKEQSKPQNTSAEGAGGGGGGDLNTSAATETNETNITATTTTPTNTPTVENGNDETLNESKVSAAGGAAESAAATENGDSNKKTKKEKLKKKWSFRSISFGKKDKQKPSKKDDETAINGECEKVPEENTEETVQNTSAEQTSNENATESGVEKPETVAAVENAKVEEKKDVDATAPAVAVNGTEPEQIIKESPTASKSSEIVPAPENNTKTEAIDEQQSTEKVISEQQQQQPPTEVPSNLKGASEIVTPPAKIEEQPILTTPAVIEVPKEVDAAAVSVKQDENVVTVDDVPKKESSDEKSKDEVVGQTEVVSPVVEEQQKTTQVPETAVDQPEATKKTDEVPEEQKPTEPLPEPIVEAPVVAKTEETVESAKPAVTENVEANIVSSESLEVVKESAAAAAAATSELSPECPKSESDINSEQIAQTIALIDEVTQEALTVTATQQKLEEPSSEQTDTPTDQQTAATEIPTNNDEKPQEPCNASPLEGNISSTTTTSVPKDPETTSATTTTDSQIPPASPSPVVELNIAAAATTEQKTVEDIGDVKLESKTTIEQSSSEGTAAAAATTTTTTTEEVNKEIIPPTTEAATATADNEKTKDEIVAAAEPLKTDAATPTHEPNGIAEDHNDVVKETSATESLNGQVEKTAEEIKSEQKKLDAGAPEAAVVVPPPVTAQ